MEKTLSLNKKISLFTILIIIIAIIFTALVFSIWTVKNVENSISKNNINLAVSISSIDHIGNLIKDKDPNGEIQALTKGILDKLTNVDMLVISDMDGIRYAHPNESRLGKKFIGGDEQDIIDGKPPYVSQAEGSLGVSVRAFAPVFDSDGDQVGFIMVGTLIEKIIAEQNYAIKYIVIYSLIGLILGVVGALLLTYNIKGTLLGLEPEEITMMYVEKESILDSMYEGIIAIDNDNVITMINSAGMKILNIRDGSPIGKNIEEVVDEKDLEAILLDNSYYQKEDRINNKDVIVSLTPMKNSGETIGNIISFRDRSEFTQMAEEITGYNQLVEALRANNHEFKNQLHVILGLIQIEEYEMAKEFILKLDKGKKNIESEVLDNINNPTITGLLSGKLSRASELEIDLKIDEESSLDEPTGHGCNASLVTIIGNLLENSFEAVRESEKENKEVYISIKDRLEYIEIIVIDNGVGIEEEKIEYLFNRGFTTKESGNGIGLNLVKEKLDFNDGSIEVESEVNIGTKIIVNLPKE